MIARGITASAAMLVINPEARPGAHSALEQNRFACGSAQYVCREVRSILSSKLALTPESSVCIISSESVVVEAAMQAAEGSVLAVEYQKRDREHLAENIERFGLNNVILVDTVNPLILGQVPQPETAFITVSEQTDADVEQLLASNPNMRFLFYTLDFDRMISLKELLEKYQLTRSEVVHLDISRVNSKHMEEPFPAPWVITAKRGEALCDPLLK